MSASLFLGLLNRLMKHRKKPLFFILIVDSLPAHKATMISDRVVARAGRHGDALPARLRARTQPR
jgi:hypothetical protein